MSQSEDHRRILIGAAEAIRRRYPTLHITMDLQGSPGDPVPPIIGRHRPDFMAGAAVPPLRYVIAEAKTDWDVKQLHTVSQVTAFMGYLQSMAGNGTFILAVNGRVADRAKTMLCFCCRHLVSSQLEVELFDGLDFWTLMGEGVPLWRLS